MSALPVSVNGEAREVPSGTTVSSLLATLDLGPAPFAVEVNREIVPRSLHGTRLLEADDAVEIVTFVGGG